MGIGKSRVWCPRESLQFPAPLKIRKKKQTQRGESEKQGLKIFQNHQKHRQNPYPPPEPEPPKIQDLIHSTPSPEPPTRETHLPPANPKTNTKRRIRITRIENLSKPPKA